MSKSPQASKCNSYVTALHFSQSIGFGNQRKHLLPHAWFYYILFCIGTVLHTMARQNKNMRMHFDSKGNGAHLHFNLKHLGDTCIWLK